MEVDQVCEEGQKDEKSQDDEISIKPMQQAPCKYTLTKYVYDNETYESEICKSMEDDETSKVNW